MRAVKRHAAGVRNDIGPKKPYRQVPPADYSDEVSDEQLNDLKKRAAPAIDEDEWEAVDGPAW